MQRIFLFLFFLLLPAQLGKHFWPTYSYLLGQQIDYLSPTIYITDLIIFVLFILFVLEKPNLKPPLPFLLFCYFILFFTGILFSVRPMVGWYGLLKIFELIFIGIYIANNFNKYNLNIGLAFGIGVLVESILGICQFLSQRSVNGIFYLLGERSFNAGTPGIANASINGVLVLRPYGTFSHPNVLAGYILIAMLLIWVNLGNKISRYLYIFYILTMVVGTVCLLLTLNRTAIGIWLFLLLYALFRFINKNRKPVFAWIVTICTLTFVSFLFYISPLSYRFTQIFSENESIIQREQFIGESLNMIFSHPFIGVGLNNYLIDLPFYAKTNTTVFQLQPVHNIFLLIAAQLGIIGLGMFLWLLIIAYKNIFLCYISNNTETQRKSKFYFVILSIILILGMFDHYWLTLQQGQLLFAVVLGLCWTLHY